MIDKLEAKRNTRASQAVIFILVGLCLAAADTTVTTIVFRLSGNMTGAVFCGYAVGLALGYFGHGRITFKSKFAKPGAMTRYVIAVIFGYFFSLLVVSGLKHVLHESDALIPKLLSIPIVSGTSFVVLKLWVFRDES